MKQADRFELARALDVCYFDFEVKNIEKNDLGIFYNDLINIVPGDWTSRPLKRAIKSLNKFLEEAWKSQPNQQVNNLIFANCAFKFTRSGSNYIWAASKRSAQKIISILFSIMENENRSLPQQQNLLKKTAS